MSKNISFRKLYFAIYSITAFIFILFGLKEAIPTVVLISPWFSYSMLFLNLVSIFVVIYILIGVSYLFLSKSLKFSIHVLTWVHYLITTSFLIFIYKYIFFTKLIEDVLHLAINIFEIREFLVIIIINQIICIYNVLGTIVKNKNHKPIDILDNDF